MNAGFLTASILCACLCIGIASGQSRIVYDENPNFPWTGYMGENNGNSIHINLVTQTASTNVPISPQSGSYCAMISYDSTVEGWSGIYIQADSTWNCGQGIGLDLTGARTLTFYAKGEKGGEKVLFGYGYDTPNPQTRCTDSAHSSRYETLTNFWQRYQFDLTGLDLSHINGLFKLSLERSNNLNGAMFFLDNITYEY